MVLTATTAYRFPRDDAARALLPRRAALLSALAEQDLGFAVPRPLAPVDAEQPVGRCFLATTRVPGEPLTRAEAGRWRDGVGRDLGGVLAALSATTARIGPLVGIAADFWAGFAAGVEDELFALMSPAGRRRARRELDHVLALPRPVTPVLVHGDLGGDNLLWELSGPPRLASVIDWDDLSLDSPANDIASIAATYGWSIAADAARYIDADDAMMERARRVAATFALQQALPAARSGDVENVDDGLHAYR